MRYFPISKSAEMIHISEAGIGNTVLKQPSFSPWIFTAIFSANSASRRIGDIVDQYLNIQLAGFLEQGASVKHRIAVSAIKQQIIMGSQRVVSDLSRNLYKTKEPSFCLLRSVFILLTPLFHAWVLSA